jgi:hypothetical protein
MEIHATGETLSTLGMSKSAQQELFGNAFITAVAGVAGCALQEPRPDHDSIDWTLSCMLRSRPRLDVQMKTTTTDAGNDEHISYAIKKKNYDDLIITDIYTPRILILVILPKYIDDWLNLTQDQLALRKCAYWVSLAGLPESTNTHSVTISIPRNNLFTPATVEQMMHTINEGGQL